jgi:hypothetical protein
MNGNGVPTIESLSAELAHCRQLIGVIRQQRDQALSAANDLQAELVLAQQQREAQEALPPTVEF